MKSIIIGALLSALVSLPVHAATTCVLIGDSIMSGVSPSVIGGPNGRAVELAASVITTRRQVIIKNISSPGNALGPSDYSGFGNVIPTLQMIGGTFSAFNCIIVQAGTNDFGRNININDTTNSLRRIANFAKNNNKKLIVVDPIWRRNEATKNTQGNPLSTYRFYMAIVCQEFPTTCTWVPRGPTFDSASASKYYDANERAAGTELHLNAAGQAAWADIVIRKAAEKKIF